MAASTVTSARGAGTSRGGGRWKGAGVETARDDNPRFLIDGTSVAPGNGSVRASADLACVGGDEDGVQAWARRSGGGHIYSEENSSWKSSRTQTKPGQLGPPFMPASQKRSTDANWGAREAFGPRQVQTLAGHRQDPLSTTAKAETAKASATARRTTQAWQTEGLRAGTRSIHLEAP